MRTRGRGDQTHTFPAHSHCIFCLGGADICIDNLINVERDYVVYASRFEIGLSALLSAIMPQFHSLRSYDKMFRTHHVPPCNS